MNWQTLKEKDAFGVPEPQWNMSLIDMQLSGDFKDHCGLSFDHTLSADTSLR